MAGWEHLADVDEAWVWRVPHPGDPLGVKRGVFQSRLGTGGPERFEPVLEIRTRVAGVADLVGQKLLDVTGRKPTEVGSFAMRRYGDSTGILGATCTIDGVLASFAVDGSFEVGAAGDRCTMATRGAPVPPRPMEGLGDSLGKIGDGLLSFGARLAKREEEAKRSGVGRALSERRARADARGELARQSAALPDVVEVEPTAFDGWLTASQVLTPVTEAVAEAWHIRIDRTRPAPGPQVPALVMCCAALCHRRSMRRQ